MAQKDENGDDLPKRTKYGFTPPPDMGHLSRRLWFGDTTLTPKLSGFAETVGLPHSHMATSFRPLDFNPHPAFTGGCGFGGTTLTPKLSGFAETVL